MKLRIDFGMHGTKREVKWWQPFEDFPTALEFQGQRWEWFMYQDDPSRQYDKILIFTNMKIGDSRWWNCLDFESRFGSYGPKCECGAIHTGFPQFHMFFCPLWSKQ